MTKKRILLFNGNQVTAYLWHNGQLKAEGCFLPQAEGLQAFAMYLQQQKVSLFYWLADVAEESFQLEDIPYVQGRDRTALITRRLKQYFYATPLSTALSLGRSGTGRRDEKVLFLALTRPEAMTIWLDAMQQQETTLAGIYSVSLILSRSAPRWLATDEPTLLITQTASGVHQSFFADKKLQFSRLTTVASHPNHAQNSAEIAQVITTESVKTYQYLVGQRQIKPRTPIRVALLVAPEHKLLIEKQCPRTELLEFYFLDTESIAKDEKLKPSNHLPPSSITPDQLLMHCLVIKPPAQQFSPESLRHLYRLWQLRLTLTSVAIISLVAGFLFAIKTSFDTSQLRKETTNAINQATIATQRYNALLASLPPTTISPDNLRSLMVRYASLQKNTADLPPLLTHLSQVLNDYSAVELIGLEWKVETAVTLPSGAHPLNPAIAGRASATSPAGASSMNGQPVVTLKVTAQLPLGFSTDLRAQKKYIEQFVQQLKNPQTQVFLLTMPFEVESGKALKSLQSAVDTSNSSAPIFSVMLVRPLLTAP